LDECSFTEVPKAYYIISNRQREVFITPVTWKRTILTLQQCI